ncbi:XdhC family protein [uncultured Amnibacterium sp.]|uniref:XdhC family protein n=1 Tax=uncultured Amnibacterium sp. TaxID=1631851 RepID=UPI0035CA6D45
MLELADRLLPLVAAGEPLAVATAIDVLGSAPHGAGTSMAVTRSGAVLGSVSGGCVEEAALRECLGLLRGGRARVRRFGFGDAAALHAGLACGGELDVLVHPLGGPAVEAQLRVAAAGEPAALAVVTSGPARVLGRAVTARTVDELSALVPGLSAARLRSALEGAQDAARPGLVEVACDPVAIRLLVDVAAPAPRMVIGGATETAVALAAAATAVGFRVTVCDPRAAFAQRDRFPSAAAVHVGRVHELVAAARLTSRDAVCLLGHDEDLDPLALAAALESPAGYVGALGSRSTAQRRRQRLAVLGTAPEAIARLRMPMGLDLGSRTPAEIAVSVLAEVLAVRASGDATPLRSGAGPIHRTTAAV